MASQSNNTGQSNGDGNGENYGNRNTRPCPQPTDMNPQLNHPELPPVRIFMIPAVGSSYAPRASTLLGAFPYLPTTSWLRIQFRLVSLKRLLDTIRSFIVRPFLELLVQSALRLVPSMEDFEQASRLQLHYNMYRNHSVHRTLVSNLAADVCDLKHAHMMKHNRDFELGRHPTQEELQADADAWRVITRMEEIHTLLSGDVVLPANLNSIEIRGHRGPADTHPAMLRIMMLTNWVFELANHREPTGTSLDDETTEEFFMVLVRADYYWITDRWMDDDE